VAGAPGEIIGGAADGLEIAAGKGSLILARAQFENGDEDDARAVLDADRARPRALL